MNIDIKVLEKLPLAICITDNKGFIKFANQKLIEIYSTTSSPLKKHFRKLVDIEKETFNRLVSPLLTGNSQHVNFRKKVCLNYESRNFEWSIATFEEKNEPYLLISGTELIEKTKFEEETLRDQYFFHLLMEKMPDHIYFKDKQSRFLKVSKAFQDKYMNCVKEITGKTDFDIFTEEHARQAYDDEQQIINTGKILENIEEQETRKDGTQSWVSTTKSPYFDENGNIAGTFGISRDITVRKVAQQALLESEHKLKELNAMKDKFFSIIAHDLRSPFNGLFGLLNMIIEEIENKSYATVLEKLRLMSSVINKIFHLLEDLLEWGNIQSRSIQYRPAEGNICNTIQCVLDLYAVNAKNKNINLHINIPDKLVINYDEKMISAVIRNLLTNAIKFTNAGGTIKICAEENNDVLRISISDSGVGISEMNINKLFNLTQYFSTKGTDNETGTGLGLILCKEFVEIHGGKISVESQINNGSTFTIYLPKT